MSKIDLISGKWSDLVFDSRNKAYGAYAIRQQTGKRNVWSMLAVLLLGVLMYGGLQLKNKIDADREARLRQEQAAELSALEAEAEKKKDEPKVERQEIIQEKKEVIEEVKSSTAFQVPEIKKDDQVKNQVVSQDEVMEKKEAIGSFNVEGNSDKGATLKVEQQLKEEKVEEKPKEDLSRKVFDVVEKMPSYPGGNGALQKWLASNITYPAAAAENGVEGRVIVAFVVEPDGSVSDVRIARGVDPSLDREALSVVKRMPKWIPGMQNGSPVRVKFNVPVTFKLQK
ncbi:MAG: TonB family protein [Prevotella sp.]|jgi:protein TonB|nr:TonB family protein [Prevotella sp.]MBR4368273.1 TonB family protein [Prevotella sp.]